MLEQLADPLPADIEGAVIIPQRAFIDKRGSFYEILREGQDPFEATKFVQQNQSFNYCGSLRGMHFQKKNPQGKLITCLYGVILDVIFDLRPESRTFMKGVGIELDFNEPRSLYVPPGCAHGFVTLSRFAVVHYSCTTYWDKESDAGVNWESPQIRSFFPEDIQVTLSEKDSSLPSVDEYLKEIL